MLAVGAQVRVMPPFNATFDGVYTVFAIDTADDGQTVVLLSDLECAFSPEYLEVV